MVDGRIFEYQTFKGFAGFDPGTLRPETDKTTLPPQSLHYLLKFFCSQGYHTQNKKERKTQRKSRLEPQIRTT
jgi:hypothetical protein